MPEETKNADSKTLEQRVNALGGIEKLEGDIEYLHSIVFAVTAEALANTKHETELTPDEVQSMFLDVSAVDDDKTDSILSALLFVGGLKARKRSIDYAAKNKLARTVADSQARYNRWAAANPKLAANALTNLPVMLSYGIIGEELFKTMFAEAQAAAKANQAQTAAAL